MLQVIRFGILLIPSVLVCIFTGLIIGTLTQQRRKRQRLMQTRDARMTSEYQLNILLINIAIMFLLIRMPYVIFYYLYQYRASVFSDVTPWIQYRLYACMSISQSICVANYACNIFLFSFCGSSFRTELVQFFRCRRKRRKFDRTGSGGSMFTSQRTTVHRHPHRRRHHHRHHHQQPQPPPQPPPPTTTLTN